MKILFSQRGSVLVFIIFFIAVLLVFIAFLPDLNTADFQIAANQRGGAEAHYLAAAGIEVAINLLTEDPFYRGSGNIPFADGEITLSINDFYKKERDAIKKRDVISRWTRIISTGEIGRMRHSIYIELNLIPPIGERIDGFDINWYSPITREILFGSFSGGMKSVVLGSSDMSVSLTLPGGTGESAFLSAEKIYFCGSPQSLSLGGPLELETSYASFQGSVILYPPDGSLTFSPFASGPVKVYLREGVAAEDGSLLLEPGVYSFPDGFDLTIGMLPSQGAPYRTSLFVLEKANRKGEIKTNTDLKNPE